MSLVRLLDTLALDSWWVPRNPLSIFGTAAAAGGDAWLASDASAFASTRIESRDTAGAYVFRAALAPGATKEEVAVEVEVDEGSNVLVIAGERSARREVERGGGWRRHVVERSCATFLGRFHLPDDAAVDGVRAALDLDAGVLTVTVPKAPAGADEAPAPVAAVEEAGAAC